MILTMVGISTVWRGMQHEIEPQYFSGPYQPRETNLYLAKIAQHYADASRTKFSAAQAIRIEQEHHQRQALHWFFCTYGASKADFEGFCEDANLNPGWVRSLIKMALKYQSPPHEVRMALKLASQQ